MGFKSWELNVREVYTKPGTTIYNKLTSSRTEKTGGETCQLLLDLVVSSTWPKSKLTLSESSAKSPLVSSKAEVHTGYQEHQK